MYIHTHIYVPAYAHIHIMYNRGIYFNMFYRFIFVVYLFCILFYNFNLYFSGTRQGKKHRPSKEKTFKGVQCIYRKRNIYIHIRQYINEKRTCVYIYAYTFTEVRVNIGKTT